MSKQSITTLSSGLALFSMFFGAGNVTFPLLVGHFAGDKNNIAMLGLFLTAVFMPVVGLIAVSLFDCDYRAFFHRLGKLPGLLLIILGIALVGPLLAIPRTVTVAYSTFHYALPSTSIAVFSFLFCLAAYFCTVKKSMLVEIIGVLLTPLLLLLLLLIIGVGLFAPLSPQVQYQSNLAIFWQGMVAGYNTLDLIAALFFSSIIMANIKKHWPHNQEDKQKKAAKECVKAGLIGGSLLALVYYGISHVSALYASQFAIVDVDAAELLAALTANILGQYALPIAVAVVLLACFTTAISLLAIAAEFAQKACQHMGGALSYRAVLLLVIGVSFFISLLGFQTIMQLLAPLVIIFYPVYITLCVCNIGFKLQGWPAIKLPAAVMLIVSLYSYFA